MESCLINHQRGSGVVGISDLMAGTSFVLYTSSISEPVGQEYYGTITKSYCSLFDH